MLDLDKRKQSAQLRSCDVRKLNRISHVNKKQRRTTAITTSRLTLNNSVMKITNPTNLKQLITKITSV